jgi:phosphohistidine phosphatase
MNLYIIRHAWAADSGDPRWPNDDARPLTADGVERFAAVVEKLVDRGMKPSLIATSPLVRCIETAQIVAAGLPDRPKIVELNELRPGSDLPVILHWTAKNAGKHPEIAWIGHAPDVSRLTAAMIGDGNSQIRFTKAAVASIRFDGSPALAAGELQWLATARLLGV